VLFRSIRREVLKLVELRAVYMKNPALGDLDSVTEVSRSAGEP